MSNIVELNRSRVFSIEDVEEILPIVRRITDEYFEKLQSMMSRLEALRSREDAQSEDMFHKIEQEINDNVQAWQTKLEKLGAHTKGLWIADFDSGDGYFCWKYPEDKIRYWHQYNDGFRGRIPLDKRSSDTIEPEVARERTPDL